MSKPGKVLKALCKKLGVRLTVKRGQKRVYKSVAVLKRQCANKKKKKVVRKKKVIRRRRFGTQGALESRNTSKKLFKILGIPNELERNMLLSSRMMLPGELGNSIRDSGGRIGLYRRQMENEKFRRTQFTFIDRDFTGVDFSGLKFSAISFKRVNFTDANLSNTRNPFTIYMDCNLQRTDLRGADFSGAFFLRSNFEGAIYDGNTQFPENFNPERHGMTRVNNFGKKKRHIRKRK